MNLRELSDAVLSEPKWQAIWYLTNSFFAALTCLALSRWGYLPWDDATAVLLGFFVPLGVYGFKSINGWYRYKSRYGMYAVTEKNLELALELIKEEEWKRALIYLDYILKIMPGHTRALYYSAVCKEELGDSANASARIAEYLKINPEDREALALSERVANNSV
jgi:tetratricopeptide (TPR) repeat protein